MAISLLVARCSLLVTGLGIGHARERTTSDLPAVRPGGAPYLPLVTTVLREAARVRSAALGSLNRKRPALPSCPANVQHHPERRQVRILERRCRGEQEMPVRRPEIGVGCA